MLFFPRDPHTAALAQRVKGQILKGDKPIRDNASHIRGCYPVILQFSEHSGLSAFPHLSNSVAIERQGKGSNESQPMHVKALSGDDVKRQREGKSDVSPEGRTARVTEVRSWFHLQAGGPVSIKVPLPNIATNVLKVCLKKSFSASSGEF